MAVLPSEKIALGGTIDPDAYSSTGNVTSDYLNMEFFHQAFAVVHAGVLASSATLDASIIQATSSTGAGAKAITGKSITQMDTGNNDTQAWINLRADELDVAGGFSFVALRFTFTTAAGDAGGALYGYDPRFGPAYQNDLASMAEIVD